MTKEVWINLPVKDTMRSKAFFEKLGFSFNTQRTNEQMACMLMGEKKMIFMLVQEDLFKAFARHESCDTSKAAEVLVSLDAESPEEVDSITRKAAEAGGTVFGQPGWSQGWMYGSGFTDPDGHRWNVLHMDFSKLPK